MAYLLVPDNIETTALVLRNTQVDPAEGSATSFTAANPFYQRFEVVPEHRLDALDNNGWYALADPNVRDTIEVAFLRGQRTPTVRQEEQINRSGVTFMVRLDFGVTALDYRGVYKNDGGS